MTVSRILSRRWRPVTVSILAACALAGCGSSANKANPTAAAALSPVTIETANGIPIPQHPTRIVSLSPSATEDLYAVGAGKLVVAVDRYSTRFEPWPGQTPTAVAGYRRAGENITQPVPESILRPALEVRHERSDGQARGGANPLYRARCGGGRLRELPVHLDIRAGISAP